MDSSDHLSGSPPALSVLLLLVKPNPTLLPETFAKAWPVGIVFVGGVFPSRKPLSNN